MGVTFDTLKPDATIFAALKKCPEWWKRFKDDPSLYIEIRKDNQVNVYFEGGSLARIHYCSKHKKLQIFTHHKYLGSPASSKSNSYVECSDFIGDVYEKVIERVKTCYSQKNCANGVVSKEECGEKYIQGSLIVKSRSFHLDSEFAYIDKDCDIRIDLIKCVNGVVTFVELKKMDDGRMLHETDAVPEVVFQMNRYKFFIEKYASQLLNYYQRVYDIKKSLDLPVPSKRPKSINLTPELLIFDRWEKGTSRRKEHRQRLYEILKREGIKYYTKTEF
ncbi:MAG: hypothetical protein J5767_14545 [Paludibacteraceae bacterium]|nr:hypothetical protein [Paludibacteraceae bacterium]